MESKLDTMAANESAAVKALKAHLSLNVRNVEQSIEFYRKLLGIEPSKVRTGYAKFDVHNPPLNLALNEAPITGRGALSHLGIQVASRFICDLNSRLRKQGKRRRVLISSAAQVVKASCWGE